jgi:hypothetical protein
MLTDILAGWKMSTIREKVHGVIFYCRSLQKFIQRTYSQFLDLEAAVDREDSASDSDDESSDRGMFLISDNFIWLYDRI